MKIFIFALSGFLAVACANQERDQNTISDQIISSGKACDVDPNSPNSCERLFEPAPCTKEKCEVIVVGGLDKSVIDERIRRHLIHFSNCYSPQFAANPGLSGRIATRFIISGKGHVTHSEVISSTMENEAVEACVRRTLKGIMFPEPLGGGVVEVDYPFFFSPSSSK